MLIHVAIRIGSCLLEVLNGTVCLERFLLLCIMQVDWGASSLHAWSCSLPGHCSLACCDFLVLP